MLEHYFNKLLMAFLMYGSKMSKSDLNQILLLDLTLTFRNHYCTFLNTVCRFNPRFIVYIVVSLPFE